ncbi:hypothetical protein [Streptomyces sp. NPDC001292]|uniref:hypothetical protein n=1 Tax=Streptomyces sp. NPDC001292 TaxID=3364558 RepID=UPI003677AFA5
MAPWVFGSAAVAYAVTPQLVGDRIGNPGAEGAHGQQGGVGQGPALVQPFAKRLDSLDSARGIIVSMILMACGMAVCVGDAAVRSPWLGLGGAVLLGAAYGIGVVSGLLEIQRIVTPDEMAGITGVYCALCYSGFSLPAVLAAPSTLASYTVMPAVLTLLALTSLALIATSSGRTAGALAAGGAGTAEPRPAEAPVRWPHRALPARSAHPPLDTVRPGEAVDCRPPRRAAPWGAVTALSLPSR